MCAARLAPPEVKVDYKAMLKKTDIEPLVIEAIRELIKNEDFATEIKSKIGKQIDTSTLDRELKNYEGKLHDMTLRLDGLYDDIIVELEEKIPNFFANQRNRDFPM